MKQRVPFFPSIKFWICENGGKIFERIEGDTIEEIESWRVELNADAESMNDLDNLRRSLENNQSDIFVDSSDYSSMIRIRGSSDKFKMIIESIPLTLRYTFNLGYLDVQVRNAGVKQFLLQQVVLF